MPAIQEARHRILNWVLDDPRRLFMVKLKPTLSIFLPLDNFTANFFSVLMANTWTAVRSELVHVALSRTRPHTLRYSYNLANFQHPTNIGMVRHIWRTKRPIQENIYLYKKKKKWHEKIRYFRATLKFLNWGCLCLRCVWSNNHVSIEAKTSPVETLPVLFKHPGTADVK